MAFYVSAILLEEDKLHTPQALLSNNPVYSSLTQKEIQGLIEIAACHRFRKGEVIAHIRRNLAIFIFYLPWPGKRHQEINGRS